MRRRKKKDKDETERNRKGKRKRSEGIKKGNKIRKRYMKLNQSRRKTGGRNRTRRKCMIKGIDSEAGFPWS